MPPWLQGPTPNPIEGGAGWVGASFLGLVLSWLLLKHLPEQLKLIRELLKEFRAEAEAQRAAHDRAVERLSAEFRAQRESTERHVAALTESVGGLVRQVETLLQERKP